MKRGAAERMAVGCSSGCSAFHGLAEELAWRAYAFGHLREGRSFRRAVALTIPLLAATHLPVVVTSGPVIGIGAMLVAAVTTVPFARRTSSPTTPQGTRR